MDTFNAVILAPASSCARHAAHLHLVLSAPRTSQLDGRPRLCHDHSTASSPDLFVPLARVRCSSLDTAPTPRSFIAPTLPPPRTLRVARPQRRARRPCVILRDVSTPFLTRCSSGLVWTPTRLDAIPDSSHRLCVHSQMLVQIHRAFFSRRPGLSASHIPHTSTSDASVPWRSLSLDNQPAVVQFNSSHCTNVFPVPIPPRAHASRTNLAR
ncbi:hypothetical protein CERSUDRAFT_99714 [Gelatoporia subvermispora B]|uniref:Uncharacterized protein n=1 Tax=Ceriporiopsis subvermispora (strain B) TaxID=914234 RepID=M2QZL5_CERS8|nr:hypothetical protein CERSUDRAFT_99714 [Gelatoporia subvermispora B]